MKALLIWGFLSFCSSTSQAQLDYFKQIENKNDTTLNLRYFKYVDKAIAQKLDSFFITVKNERKKKSETKDTGFIEVGIFRYTKFGENEIAARIRECNNYANYVPFLSRRVNYSNVVGFSFYKSKLILFTMIYTKTRIKDEYTSMLHDLIYSEMSSFVKQQIDTNATEYDLPPGIARRYVLEQ